MYTLYIVKRKLSAGSRKGPGGIVARMVRKQLYLDETQDTFLRQEAARRGVTQADVVRDAIDALRTGAKPDARETGWRELQHLWDQAAAQVGGTPYRFRRQDAYEVERGSG